jgi:lipid-A-disaccharide synthase
VIIISALDNSGEQNAADLVRQLRTMGITDEFIGIGGKEMAGVGCRLLHDISNTSAMLGGVIGALKWAVPVFLNLRKLIIEEKPRLVILVDSPTFNLPLARLAKKHGVKTLYYIAPQVWAWAEFRVKKIQRRVDKLAVILPFEQDYFQKFNIDAEFVGHPFLNRIENSESNPALTSEIKQINRPHVLLMPGSRKHVVHDLLSVQLSACRQIEKTIGPIALSIAAWPGVIETIQEIIKQNHYEAVLHDGTKSPFHPNKINLFTQDRRTLIESADLVLAASGTGTLEVAWYGRPMIIMYNASKIGYHLIARWLIRTKFLSLINILAGREIVPEFMPYIRDENKIVEQAVKFLKNKDLALQHGWQTEAIMRQLYRENPSEDVAKIAKSLL